METRSLDLNELETLHGGACSARAQKAISTIGLVASVASFAGPIGALIAGPTALGMGIASAYCAYSE